MRSRIFKKRIVVILTISALSLINSCGFFRTIGLYNVPPDYADTFKEVNGRDFIIHNNVAANLLVELTPLKYEYSPYDTIKLKVKIFNVSNTDTMYIKQPRMAGYHGIVVTDTAGKKMNILDWVRIPCGIHIVDKYGRIIKNTLAPYGYKLPPRDSVTNIIRIICGKVNLALVGELKSENIPGYYTAYYTQPHQEYDRIKGPIQTRVFSNKVHFKVSNYTEEQIKARERVDKIIAAVNSKSGIHKIQNLFTDFKNDYPGNLYIPQIQKIIDLYNKIIVPRLKND